MAKESPLPDPRGAAGAASSREDAARSVEELLVAVARLCQAAGGSRSTYTPSSRPPRQPEALPARDGAAASATQAADGGQPQADSANGNPTVLVVEDDPKLLELMTSTFRKAGFVTHGAENGRRALRVLDEVHADLMVTDIVMPEMEGIATMMGARARRPGIGVIAISGGGAYGRGETYLGWAGQLGADEVLPKPFRMSALLAAARVVLAGRSGSQATA